MSIFKLEFFLIFIIWKTSQNKHVKHIFKLHYLLTFRFIFIFFKLIFFILKTFLIYFFKFILWNKNMKKKYNSSFGASKRKFDSLISFFLNYWYSFLFYKQLHFFFSIYASNQVVVYGYSSSWNPSVWLQLMLKIFVLCSMFLVFLFWIENSNDGCIWHVKKKLNKKAFENIFKFIYFFLLILRAMNSHRG